MPVIKSSTDLRNNYNEISNFVMRQMKQFYNKKW